MDSLTHFTEQQGILKKKKLCTERARLGTFRGFGTERARLGAFRGLGTERARLGAFRGLGTECARLGPFRGLGTKSQKNVIFLLKKSTQPPKIRSFV